MSTGSGWDELSRNCKKASVMRVECDGVCDRSEVEGCLVQGL